MPALHIHNANRISPAGRVIMTPVLCTRAGKVVASFPAYLTLGRVVTTEAATAYFTTGRAA